MPADPTTWRTTPVCATDAMIDAGMNELRLQYPFMSLATARSLARYVIDAALRVGPKPPPLPEPPATGDANG